MSEPTLHTETDLRRLAWLNGAPNHTSVTRRGKAVGILAVATLLTLAQGAGLLNRGEASKATASPAAARTLGRNAMQNGLPLTFSGNPQFINLAAQLEVEARQKGANPSPEDDQMLLEILESDFAAQHPGQTEPKAGERVMVSPDELPPSMASVL